MSKALDKVVITYADQHRLPTLTLRDTEICQPWDTWKEESQSIESNAFTYPYHGFLMKYEGGYERNLVLDRDSDVIINGIER